MVRQAAESGVTDIVATPHADYEYRYDDALVDARIQELTTATVGHPRIHRGCELHLSFENIQSAIADPARYVIGGGPYLLVEFPNTAVKGFGTALEKLI